MLELGDSLQWHLQCVKKPNQKCDTIDRSRMLAHIPNITIMLELGDSLQWHLQCVKKPNQKCDTIDRSRMLAHIPNITTMLELGDSLQWHLQCVKKPNQKCDTIDRSRMLAHIPNITTKNSQALKKHSAVHRRWQIWILQATGDTMAKKTPAMQKKWTKRVAVHSAGNCGTYF